MARRRATPGKDSGPQALEGIVKHALQITKKARKQRRSLGGENYYADRLVELRADATNVFRDLSSRSAGDVSAMAEMLETVFSLNADQKRRADTAKELVFALRTTWKESEGSTTVTTTDQIVPLGILDKTDRGYIVSVGRQMNGCFASGWYDASAVMLRRLLEISIIEAFEHHSIQSKIKDGAGNYFQLSELISCALAESAWNLSRNTKTLLPQLRDVGHRSAHGRYYHARLEDLERIRDGARVVVEEFLHHGGLL